MDWLCFICVSIIVYTCLFCCLFYFNAYPASVWTKPHLHDLVMLAIVSQLTAGNCMALGQCGPAFVRYLVAMCRWATPIRYHLVVVWVSFIESCFCLFHMSPTDVSSRRKVSIRRAADIGCWRETGPMLAIMGLVLGQHQISASETVSPRVLS